MKTLTESFFSRFVQRTRLARLQTPLGEDALIVDAFEGCEGVCRDFRFEVSCLADRDDLELKTLMGQSVRLSVDRGREAARTWEGRVTEFAYEGSDGGFSRYRLVFEPWMALMAMRRDQYIFQEQSALAIIETVLADWADARYELRVAEPGSIPNRSFCVQAESDAHFIARLCEEEGLAWWYEFDQSGHLLVIGDSPAAWRALDRAGQGSKPASGDDALPVIRFHRAAATEASDSITRWSAFGGARPNAMRLTSHDYKPDRTRGVEDAASATQGEAPRLEQYLDRGEYGYRDHAAGTREAGIRLEAELCRMKGYRAESTDRAIAVGGLFELTHHPHHDRGARAAREFVVLDIRHVAKNNLGLAKTLDPADTASDAGLNDNWANAKNLMGAPLAVEPGTYANRFEAIARTMQYRPQRRHTRPLFDGPQTARVVGPVGQEVYTDALNRIRIKFHWDRQAHAEYGATHSNDERASCWVRVASDNADGDWGAVAVPRIGQEVIVSFLNGDPDRPLVTGRAYNGSRRPAWHSDGKLAGMKSKALGGAGFNALVFDDSTGQLRASLGTTQYAAQVNIGHLVTQPYANARGDHRGSGFELRTDAWGSLRAAAGLLITTDARANASGQTMDAREAAASMHAHGERLNALGELARKHNASGLAAHVSATNTKESISATKDNIATFAEPHLVLAGAAGLNALTPNDIHFAAGATIALSSGHDTNLAIEGDVSAVAKDSISLFAYECGARVIAARAKLEVQAQSDNVEATAQKDIKVQSVTKTIEALAGKEILLTSGGAYIRLKGGDIEIHAPGLVSFKGAQHKMDGPASMEVALPQFKLTELKDCPQKIAGAILGGASVI